jgi:DNA repair exonuclease SbcCD ATPase subunit
MIIRAIRAENFMKFASLNLSGFPEEGVIGVEGPNESGKTTIGEAVLFAFFGKTRVSLETSVSRLIRWGADYLSVEVDFHVPGRGDYLIYREIDKYGTNYVKVVEAGTRVEVATGNVNVSEFLARTLKFDFFEFHQSFYHDQRQLGTNVESQSGFVERMTGISQVREAVGNIRKEIEGLEREFAHYQKDVGRNLQQMEKYERNAAKLPELRESVRSRREDVERARADLVKRQEEAACLNRIGEDLGAAARRIEALQEESAEKVLAGLVEVRESLARFAQGNPTEQAFAAREKSEIDAIAGRAASVEAMLKEFGSLREAFQGLTGELKVRLDPEGPESLVVEERRLQDENRAASIRTRRLLVSGSLCLVLALLAGTAFGLALSRAVAIPADRTTVLVSTGGVAGATLLFAIIFLYARADSAAKLRSLGLLWNERDIRIRQDTEERDRLGALLAVGGPGEVGRFVAAARSIVDPQRAGLLREFLRTHGPLVEIEGEGEYRKVIAAISRSHRDLRSRALKEAGRIDRAAGEADAAWKKARADLDKVEGETRECESQVSKRDSLAGKNRDLEGRSGEIRREIDCRRTAIDLLEDAASSIRNKIGPSLSRFLRDVLPLLTSGRYRDIKVGSDLSLQIFTTDKGDFLDRSELSGGTQEALLLALRLAMSQAFIASRTRQSQFVFLDEPFKMMDDARALDCLKVLKSLSSDIRQFFVIQPAFSADERAQFDVLIRTEVHLTDLVVQADK